MSTTPSQQTRFSIATIVAALIVALAMLIAPAADAGKGDGKKGKGKPKLSVTEVASPPESIEAGAKLKVKGVVANDGKGTFDGGEKTVKISLRSGDVEAKLGTAPLKKIKPDKTRKFKAKLEVPSKLAGDKKYKVKACVKKKGNGGALRCKTSKGKVTVTEPGPGTTYTPGARTLDDPLFPQIGNGGYDALNYAIVLDYDPATNEFESGTSTTITAKATQNLSEFSFDFQRDLTVSAVTVNGTPANSFQQVDATPEFAPDVPDATQPAKLVVTPPAGIPQGSEFTVKVSYSGTPKEITDADESYEGWVQSCQTANFTPPCDGAYTVNEPIGVQSWFPSNNVPSDKATIDTKTTVPTTHVALGTGELDRRSDNGDGTWTWSWSEDDETAPFLATATVGLFDYSNNSSFTEDVTGRNIPIYKAIDSAKNNTAKTNFDNYTAQIPDVMNFFADRYGAYPFDSTGAVTDIAPDVGYALENQTKPHYATSLNSNGVGFGPATQAHELSHQWFGDAISPATWQQIWFSEGWATYSETAYAETPASNDTERVAFFDDIYSTPDDPGNGDTDWTLPPAELGGPENLFNGFSVYDRPGAMIEGYREIVGDTAFYAFATGLQDSYRYGNITEAQFVDAAKAASGLSGADLTKLGDYFQQWLHSASKPTLTPADF